MLTIFSLAVKSFRLSKPVERLVVSRFVRTLGDKTAETKISSLQPQVKSKSSLLHYKKSLLRKVLDKKKVNIEVEPAVIDKKKVIDEVQEISYEKNENAIILEPHSNSEVSENSHISNNLFSSLDISAKTLKAIATHFKYSNMTIVQSECIPPILTGKDAMVKAKTGTGKTIGFLIPAI